MRVLYALLLIAGDLLASEVLECSRSYMMCYATVQNERWTYTGEQKIFPCGAMIHAAVSARMSHCCIQ